MESYFASPERATAAELSAQIEFVSANPVMSGLLNSLGGLLAILDEHRQIVALNESFLEQLGIEDSASVLGLRPGEALGCVNAREMPAGCGTSFGCMSCGAAIAIVTSLADDGPAEQTCALRALQQGREVDLALQVRCQPIRLENRRFLLLYLQDVSRQQQRAALERTFLHDVNNILQMLVGASDLLQSECPSATAEVVRQAVRRLQGEVTIQRCLLADGASSYQPQWKECSCRQIREELELFFRNHPTARERNLEFTGGDSGAVISDCALLLRILCNMIINALEATLAGGTVRVWIEMMDRERLSFQVWNQAEIPESIRPRIFQRNFSTKNEAGRGLGTYSMKLFGEQVLGGSVSFSSSAAEGTVFTLSLPKIAAPEQS